MSAAAMDRNVAVIALYGDTFIHTYHQMSRLCRELSTTYVPAALRKLVAHRRGYRHARGGRRRAEFVGPSSIAISPRWWKRDLGHRYRQPSRARRAPTRGLLPPRACAIEGPYTTL